MLAIEDMRSWAGELAHMFNRNADMQGRTQVFSCYERGLEKTILRDFEQGGKEIAISGPQRRRVKLAL